MWKATAEYIHIVAGHAPSVERRRVLLVSSAVLVKGLCSFFFYSGDNFSVGWLQFWNKTPVSFG